MDRSVVAALTGTTPRLIPKSSTKDLASLRLVWDVSAYVRPAPLRRPLKSVARAALSERAVHDTLGAPAPDPSRILASNHRDVNKIVGNLDGILT